MDKYEPTGPEEREAWKECCQEDETLSIDSSVLLRLIADVERLQAQVSRLNEAAASKEEEQEEESD